MFNKSQGAMENSTQSNSRIMKMQVHRKLKQCLSLAENYYERAFKMPEINYNLHGVKAGVAYLQENKIKLNLILLQENNQKFVEEVVPHELSHLLAYQLFGQVKPHGIEWQTIMIDIFKLPAHTCHKFDISNARKSFTYQCKCQTHKLSSVRHNKIVKSQASYLCKRCKNPLSFKVDT